MIPTAFTYEVWRKVKALERNLQLHPETPEEQIQERLQLIIDEANENRRLVEMRLQEKELENQKLTDNPRPKLY